MEKQQSDSLMVACRARVGPGVSIPPTAAFVLPFVLGCTLHTAWPAYALWPAEPLGTAAGMTLVLAAALLFAWAMWTFHSVQTGIMLQKPATRVVTTGPYRWSRNPMYVAFVLAYAGAASLFESWWPWVLMPLAVATLRLSVVAREERYMRKNFPVEYGAYCQRVPRWL